MIEIKNLCKTFQTADGEVEALKNVNITVGDGDIFGIIGMSGAGKSTLVRCINMLERPTEGQVLIDGTDIGTLPEKQLREIRRNVTMIFQGFNLLMQRTCLKKICFPTPIQPILIIPSLRCIIFKRTGCILRWTNRLKRKMIISKNTTEETLKRTPRIIIHACFQP